MNIHDLYQLRKQSFFILALLFSTVLCTLVLLFYTLSATSAEDDRENGEISRIAVNPNNTKNMAKLSIFISMKQADKKQQD